MPRGLGASILCILPALYFLGIVAYAAMNSPYYSLTWVLFNRYILGPACVAAFLIISAIWVRRDVRLTIGIVATSLLSGLFVFEIFLTFRNVPKTLGMLGVTDEGVDITRFKENVPPAYTVKALNRALKTQTLSEAVLGVLPEKEVFLCARNGQPLSYQADRFGFRNPDQLWDTDPDVLIIGDSFTEGICLAEGDDLAGQLRKHYPNTLNTGTRGAGPLLELATLGRFGPEFRPKVTVMVFFAGNDWENLSEEVKYPWLMEVFEPDPDFGPTYVPKRIIEKSAQAIHGWWNDVDLSFSALLKRRRYVRNFLALQNTASVLGLHYPKGSLEQPVFDDVLSRASQIVSEWNGKLIMVYVPPVDRFVGALPQGIAHDHLRSMVLNSAMLNGVDVVDLTTVFEATDNPKLQYAPDAHFSEAGASLAATAIANKVSEVIGSK